MHQLIQRLGPPSYLKKKVSYHIDLEACHTSVYLRRKEHICLSPETKYTRLVNNLK